MAASKLTRNYLFAAICFTLAVVTLAIYWPVTRHEFIGLDDQQYITSNKTVQAGLTWHGFVWAFENTESANWHPLTWISHMTDCQLFGLNPAGHHLMNVFFHIANTLLLFFFLNRTTGALWRSFFVAAFFAWHPLHVESVAWAAERKDVLSAFFWMLTLIVYAHFSKKRSILNYVLALFLFACGLMSKPMVVTLPFVLLLLDFWPLNRFATTKTSTLLLEKIPFLALALAESVATYLVQKSAGATWSAEGLPLHIRIANVLVSYVRYISKTFCPTDLAVIYPFQRHWPIAIIIGSALLLIVWSVLVILHARRQPYLFTGWFWFLGTLVPVIGFVQVGAQSIADRYTYIPSIGLFILVVWGANDLLNRWPEQKKFLPLAGGVALAGCLMVTSIQLNYWQNSVKLFAHTIEVTTDNYTAFNFLGLALEKLGQKDAALQCYAKSVQIAPRYPQAQFNLGMNLWNAGRLDEACDHLQAAVQLVPDNAAARYYLAKILARRHKSREAILQYRAALRLTPDFPEALNELAWILATDPDSKIRSGAEAVQFARHACELTQNKQAAFLTTFAAACAETGQFSEAVSTAQKARNLAEADGQKEIMAQDEELLKLFQTNRPFREPL